MPDIRILRSFAALTPAQDDVGVFNARGISGTIARMEIEAPA